MEVWFLCSLSISLSNYYVMTVIYILTLVFGADAYVYIGYTTPTRRFSVSLNRRVGVV